jgi:transposase
VPTKSTIYSWVRKLKKTGTSKDEHGRLRQQTADAAAVDLCQVGAVSQKIFVKINLVALSLLVKELQKSIASTTQ